MTTTTTLTVIGAAAVLLAYLSSQVAEARRAARIRVRIEERRPETRDQRRSL